MYLLKLKDEAEHKLERKNKWLKYDLGGEYVSSDFSDFCVEHGIVHERTVSYSPQSNGVAERKNRTLTDLVNANVRDFGTI